MSVLKYVYEKLWCVFAIFYWIQLFDSYPYDKNYNKWCRKVLRYAKDHPEEPIFTNIGEYHALFGVVNSECTSLKPKRVWVSGIPYASFHLDDRKCSGLYSPSRYTKFLMVRQLRKDQLKKTKAEFKVY